MGHRKYFVTKWFITNGILEVTGIPHEDSDYISVRIPGRRFANSVRLGTDVFERREEAEVRGRILLRNEIIKTQKSLERLQRKLAAMDEHSGEKIYGVFQMGSGEVDGWVCQKGKVWAGSRIEAYSYAEKLKKKRPNSFLSYSVNKLPKEYIEEQTKEAVNGS